MSDESLSEVDREIDGEVKAEGLLRRENEMFGFMGSGETALRIMRRKARREGDRDTVAKLNKVLRSNEDAAIAGRALEDEIGGSLLRDILEAIWNDPEKFFMILEKIIQLLEGLFGEVATTK